MSICKLIQSSMDSASLLCSSYQGPLPGPETSSGCWLAGLVLAWP